MKQHHILTVGISLLTNFARLPVRGTQTGERRLTVDDALADLVSASAGTRGGQISF